MNINFIFDSFYKNEPECNVIPLKGYHTPVTGYNSEFLLYRPLTEMLTYNNDVASRNKINFISYICSRNHIRTNPNDKNFYFIQVRTDEFDSQWALNYIPKYIVDAANNSELKIVFSSMYISPPIRDANEWIEKIKHKSKMIGLKNLNNLIFIWCDYRSTETYQNLIKEMFDKSVEKITDPLLMEHYNNFQQYGYPRIVDSNIWERAIIPSLKKFHPMNESHIENYLDADKNKLFLYFNNSQKDHRFILYKYLEMENLLEYSLCSYRYGDHASNFNLNKHGFFDQENGQFIQNYILQNPEIVEKKLDDDKLFCDSSRITGKSGWDLPLMAAYCSTDQIVSTCFSLVTESSEHNHMSEKCYKCFYYGHPFIVLGGKGYLQHLKKLGYKTFDFLFDESYDELEHCPKKLEMIVNEVKRYCTPDGIQKFMSHKTQLQDVLEHNRNHFLTKDHTEFWASI